MQADRNLYRNDPPTSMGLSDIGSNLNWTVQDAEYQLKELNADLVKCLERFENNTSKMSRNISYISSRRSSVVSIENTDDSRTLQSIRQLLSDANFDRNENVLVTVQQLLTQFSLLKVNRDQESRIFSEENSNKLQEIMNLKGDKAVLERQLSNANDKLRTAEDNARDMQSKNAEIEKLSNQITELKIVYEKLNEEFEAKKNGNLELRKRIKEINSEKQTLEKKCEEQMIILQEQKNTHEMELNNQEASAKNLENELNERLEELDIENKRLETENQTLNNQLIFRKTTSNRDYHQNNNPGMAAAGRGATVHRKISDTASPEYGGGAHRGRTRPAAAAAGMGVAGAARNAGDTFNPHPAWWNKHSIHGKAGRFDGTKPGPAIIPRAPSPPNYNDHTGYPQLGFERMMPPGADAEIASSSSDQTLVECMFCKKKFTEATLTKHEENCY